VAQFGESKNFDGNIAWNWNAGIASPKLPAQNTPAK
jgi:hypothetical protein